MNNSTRFHVIKDPVHGTMQFTTDEDRWLKPFIDSPTFQRLRHIKQLGMGDYIFPGAVHTRFNHSLGCAYTASQISQKIDVPPEDRQLVLIACLLHDIGHGPFSHTFEDLFLEKKIRHEQWTPYFLAEYRTEKFFTHYNKLNPDYPLNVEKFARVADMIMHCSPSNLLLADIVSSQLDADRLDYLLRDSHFCGVTYGQYDFRWMLNSLVTVMSDNCPRLGINHKGIGVAEQYLMARRLMLKNIYYHQKKLAFEYFLIKLLALLAEDLTHPLFKNIKKNFLGNFLINVHQFNQDPIAEVANFLEKNYMIYKELCDYDVFQIIRTLNEIISDHPAVQIAKRLHHRIMPKIKHIDIAKLSQVEEQIKIFKSQQAAKIEDWQLTVLKTPAQSYIAEEESILVINELGSVKTLNELSVMMQAISGKMEPSAFLVFDQSIEYLIEPSFFSSHLI